MKIIYALILATCTNLCFAVGWEEVSKETASDFNVEINIEYEESSGCHKIFAKLPNEIFFSELGEREFAGAHYRKITEKARGWQLMSEGTYIGLETTPKGKHNDVSRVCLTKEDLEFGYLSAGYSGASGTPPMVVIIKLSDFK